MMRLKENMSFDLLTKVRDNIGSMSLEKLDELLDSLPDFEMPVEDGDTGLDTQTFNYTDVVDQLSGEEEVGHVFREFVLQQLLDNKTSREAYDFAIGPTWKANPSDINDLSEGIVAYFSKNINLFVQSDLYRDYVDEVLIPNMEDQLDEWTLDSKMNNNSPRE